jgi:integrase
VSNLRRVPYTKPIPEGAQLFTRKGERFARFKDRRGKTVEVPLTEDGTRIRLLSRKWYGEYKDADGVERCVPLATDRTAAEQMLAERVRKAELGRAGIADPFEEHRKRPLLEHLEDYRRELEARGNDPSYTELAVSRLKQLLAACGFVFTPDLSASRAVNWLAALRRPGKPPALEPGKEQWTCCELASLLGIQPGSLHLLIRRHRLQAHGNGTRRRYPRATVEALLDRRCQGASVATTNHYLGHLKAFCRWLVKDGRMGPNPIERLTAGNAEVDRRHNRRELEADELRRLLAAARDSTRSYGGLTGWERYHLYATACGTGFRASALVSLTPESFDLDADPPTVTLAAKRNKSRKLKVQPLPADVADLLRDFLRDKPPGQPIWADRWIRDSRAADMLRIDLEAAGIPYEVEGPDGPLYADFLALRHTYLTLASRAGVDLRTLQELAGHSNPTLTARYSHRRLHDLAGAVEKLPGFLPEPPDGETLRATGTEGGPPSPSNSDGGCEVESLRQACAAGEAGGFRLRVPESAVSLPDAGAGLPNPLGLKVVESGCALVTAAEGVGEKEAVVSCFGANRPAARRVEL